MPRAALVLPNQLFRANAAVGACNDVFLLEEWLYFRELPFLQQKLVYARACMKRYADVLRATKPIEYIDCTAPHADIRAFVPWLRGRGVDELHLCDPLDDWIERRLAKACGQHGMALVIHPSPAVLLTHDDAIHYQPRGSAFYQLDFYVEQRKRLNILLEPDGTPNGGHWSYDAQNRKRLPRTIRLPRVSLPGAADTYLDEAKAFVGARFSQNPGRPEMAWEDGQHAYFPTSHEDAEHWLDTFLAERFRDFGPYQDALVPQQNVLFHAAITPMLNLGLLEPEAVVRKAVDFGQKNGVPLPSVEGFVRQVVGWREYVRMTYAQAGRRMRTTNYFRFAHRPVPKAFWDGTTGIPPVDNVIRKVLRVGWCHHIERLMVIGNFMLLCGVHPDEVYCWFSALFIDAYDWVMVPNVYGMSQFADGGLIATKPYISGSANLMKMGRYDGGAWQGVWDALYWRFLLVHEDALRQIRRGEAMPDAKAVLDPARRKLVMQLAEDFLEKLWA